MPGGISYTNVAHREQNILDLTSNRSKIDRFSRTRENGDNCDGKKCALNLKWFTVASHHALGAASFHYRHGLVVNTSVAKAAQHFLNVLITLSQWKSHGLIEEK